MTKTNNETANSQVQKRIEFTNQYVFGRVMCDTDILKDVLSCILGIKIEKIESSNAEQVLEPTPQSRGVRLDVLAKADGKIYDIEMQLEPKVAHTRRMRYYQASIDKTALGKGDRYDELADSFIIFLCRHDPFKHNLPIYTIQRACKEDSTINIDSGDKWITLNSKAFEDVKDKNLSELLHYVNNNIVGKSNLVKRIDDAVREANEDAEWVRKVHGVSTIEEDYKREARMREKLARKEGLAEGLIEGEDRLGKLIAALIASGRTKDVEAAATDPSCRANLFAEFGI